MKSQISSLELFYLVRELQQLVDGKVDKIYHPSRDELIFTIHTPGTGKKILRILAGKCMYLTEFREPAEEPTNFCVFLRKHLSNARIREINQLQPERIVQIVFEKKEGKKTLVVELFGRGNVILLDDNNSILSAIDYHKFKDRTIRPKELYTYPKKEINFFSLNGNAFKQALKKTEKDSVATFLAVDIGIGGIFSEEACHIASVDKSKSPKEISEKQASLLFDALNVLKDSRAEPNIIRVKGKIVDALPIRLNIYKNEGTEFPGSFSAAIDIGFSEEIKVSPKEREMRRLERIIGAQEEKIKELELSEQQSREKAESIFQNYRMVDGILKELRAIEKKHSWHEIKDRLKGHRLIKEVDVKEKRVVIELDS